MTEPVSAQRPVPDFAALVAAISEVHRALRRSRAFYVAYPEIGGTLSPELAIPPQRLVQSLSFSHFAELVTVSEPLKRRFYEVECLRGNWSVRKLKRQVASPYYERSGLSTDKNKLAAHVQGQAEQFAATLNVRDPYVFEFLGLKSQEEVPKKGSGNSPPTK